MTSQDKMKGADFHYTMSPISAQKMRSTDRFATTTQDDTFSQTRTVFSRDPTSEVKGSFHNVNLKNRYSKSNLSRSRQSRCSLRS